MNAQENAQDEVLTKEERAELVRLAKLSAKDSGPAFVILPRELKRLQRLDNRTLSAVVQEVALNFAGIDSGDAFDEETRALMARMTEAQAVYTEAWIKERKRRNLPILPQHATGKGRVYLAHGKAKGGADMNAKDTHDADARATADYFRSNLTDNEIRAISKAAESQKNLPFPGCAILKTSADWIFEQPDGRGVKFLFCGAICGEISFTYEGKQETLTISLEDELRAEPFPINPGTLSGIDRFHIERMSATIRLYLAAWRFHSEPNISHDMMVGAAIMHRNSSDALSLFKVIDDETGEVWPLFPPNGPDFEKETTPGYENSPLWGAAYIGADGGRPSFGAGLLIQAAAVRYCAEGGKIDRDLLVEVTGPAIEITNGLPPHFPTDPETRAISAKVIAEAEKSVGRFLDDRKKGEKGKGYGHLGGQYGHLGGRPKRDNGKTPKKAETPLRGFSETPSETPRNEETKEIETFRNEPNRTESRARACKGNLGSDRVGSDRVDNLITNTAAKIGDTKPSRKAWRQFIDRHGEEAFTRIAEEVASAPGVSNVGAYFNTRLRAYEPPKPTPPPKPTQWKPEDWELCWASDGGPCPAWKGGRCTYLVEDPPGHGAQANTNAAECYNRICTRLHKPQTTANDESWKKGLPPGMIYQQEGYDTCKRLGI